MLHRMDYVNSFTMLIKALKISFLGLESEQFSGSVFLTLLAN